MTRLVINNTGDVVVSSDTPDSPADLYDYFQALGSLGSTEISIQNGGELWFSGNAKDGQLMVSSLANDMAGGTVVFGDSGNNIFDSSTGDYFVGGPGNDSIFLDNTAIELVSVIRLDDSVIELYDDRNGYSVFGEEVENMLTPFNGISFDSPLLL